MSSSETPLPNSMVEPPSPLPQLTGELSAPASAVRPTLAAPMLAFGIVQMPTPQRPRLQTAQRRPLLRAGGWTLVPRHPQ